MRFPLLAAAIWVGCRSLHAFFPVVQTPSVEQSWSASLENLVSPSYARYIAQETSPSGEPLKSVFVPSCDSHEEGDQSCSLLGLGARYPVRSRANSSVEDLLQLVRVRVPMSRLAWHILEQRIQFESSQGYAQTEVVLWNLGFRRTNGSLVTRMPRFAAAATHRLFPNFVVVGPRTGGQLETVSFWEAIFFLSTPADLLRAWGWTATQDWFDWRDVALSQAVYFLFTGW